MQEEEYRRVLFKMDIFPPPHTQFDLCFICVLSNVINGDKESSGLHPHSGVNVMIITGAGGLKWESCKDLVK